MPRFPNRPPLTYNTLMFSIAFSVLMTATCSYESGFSAGVERAGTNSYGLNIDQQCQAASDDEKKAFREGFNMGMQKGERVKELGLEISPKNAVQTEKLIDAAERESKINELEKKMRKEKRETGASSERMKKLIDEKEAAEAEKKKLEEEAAKAAKEREENAAKEAAMGSNSLGNSTTNPAPQLPVTPETPDDSNQNP